MPKKLNLVYKIFSRVFLKVELKSFFSSKTIKGEKSSITFVADCQTGWKKGKQKTALKQVLDDVTRHKRAKSILCIQDEMNQPQNFVIFHQNGEREAKRQHD